MKIIIPGGSGLIGTALTTLLARNSHQVIVLSRRPEIVQPRLPSGASAMLWDGMTTHGWGEQVEGADAVVNLAGENIGAQRWTPSRKHAILHSRVNAGKAVLQAILGAKAKPKMLLQASAVGYYGASDDRLLPETALAGDDFMAEICKPWENSTAAAEEAGVRRVVVRTGVVLSSRKGALPRLLLPMRLFIGGPLGSGRQPFPWIHLDDMAAALRFFIEHPETSGIYNLSAPGELTNASLARLLGRILHRPSFLPVPAFALRLLLGEMSAAVLEGQRVDPSRLIAAGFRFSHTQAEEALRDVLERGI
jgi:uncharacterized protein (TIGR01777 family)